MGRKRGARKVCMGIHQYDIRELRRIAQLGTWPTARGSFAPTARIASYMTLFDLSSRYGFSILRLPFRYSLCFWIHLYRLFDQIGADRTHRQYVASFLPLAVCEVDNM